MLVVTALAANPIPTVVGPVSPQAVVPGSGAFILTVYGANFVSGAVVNWNRSPRSTTFISARELQGQILASDVATATAGYITVTNPPPGGGISSSSFGLVEVHTPTATIVAKKPHVYLKNNSAPFVVPTDFNNDGIVDFAASHGSEIRVLMGNGDSTFRKGSNAAYNYFDQAAIASGDFNNDGEVDLVFGADVFGPPTELQVSLGNGDGTFRKGSRFGHFDVWPFDIAVGDFNGDGNLDLIAEEGNLFVFLGNGDGTFKHLVDYSDAGGLIVSADFNGDGKLDLVAGIRGGLAVLLGNGDGTFQKPRKIASVDNFGCGFGPPIFVTDFNADGNPDLAFCETDQLNGKLWIMLGNGDGTFKKPVSIPIQSGIYGFTFAVGDFNSDGKTDLVTNYLVSDTQSEFALLLGNGDGTFQHRRVVSLAGGPHEGSSGIVPADFNSDGLLDFIIQDPGQVVVFAQK